MTAVFLCKPSSIEASGSANAARQNILNFPMSNTDMKTRSHKVWLQPHLQMALRSASLVQRPMERHKGTHREVLD